MYRRAHAVLIGTTALMGIVAVYLSQRFDAPLVDPEGFLGPGIVRLPMLILIALLADMAPQYFWVGRSHPRTGWAAMKRRWKSHWNRERWTLVVIGITCFYVTYVSYRNIKSALPKVMGEQKYDRELHVLDRALFFGEEPANVLQAVFGTGISAHVLSTIYMAFLPLVAVMVAIYLVWARKIRFGYWFVISQVLIWSLGTAMYYTLPTLGPGFRYTWLYADITPTATGDLMDALFYGRKAVTWDGADERIQSIAAFASLHTGVTVLWALMIQYTLRSRWVKVVAWVNVILTVIATLYFGWHYVADDIGGAAIALVSFYVAGWAAGIDMSKKGLRVGRYADLPDPELEPPVLSEMSSPPSHAP